MDMTRSLRVAAIEGVVTRGGKDVLFDGVTALWKLGNMAFSYALSSAALL